MVLRIGDLLAGSAPADARGDERHILTRRVIYESSGTSTPTLVGGMEPLNIAVIGTGYVGLTAAAAFAHLGHAVTGVDIDEERIAGLNGGIVPIFEPGLAELIDEGTAAGRLAFTTDHAAAVADADAVFVTVGSPTTPSGKADLSFVDAALEQIAPSLLEGTTVVIKSTVPVGTTERTRQILDELRPDLDLDVAANPEFLRQGRAVHDFLHPDRLVVGADGERAQATMRRLYDPLLEGEAAVDALFTDTATAELIKYGSNAFLAVKLSFINEMADLAEETGADIDDVARGIGLDPRIGPAFLQAGPGFGGSCLPKDTEALLFTGRSHGVSSRVVAAAIDVNEERKGQMISRIADAVGRPLADATIGVLGITFKAGTDDLRESPAVDIVRGLIGHGATVRVTDPEGMDAARAVLPTASYFDDPYGAIEGADAVVIATEWPEFAKLDLGRIADLAAQPVVVDLRNLLDPAEAAAAGLRYSSIGRPRRAR
jgi:UDPglucose 6-dehydrogenase